MSMRYEGTVYLFGNDVNTDEIIPARYLTTTDPALLASKCMEDARPGFGMAVHLAIPFLGLALVDNVDPERLAQACAEHGRNEFLFTATPLRLVGATGAPAHPIAIF